MTATNIMLLFGRKQKILDYEIETRIPNASMTILIVGRKQKILDYEIETRIREFRWYCPSLVENKRFSITRLKRHLATIDRDLHHKS